jgi:hypothetical protein
MLTLDTFLSLFHSRTTPDYNYFFRNAKVRIHNKIISLKEYCIKKNIHTQDIKLLFENIRRRDLYLTRFYNKSLKCPNSLMITEDPMKKREMNNDKNVIYKNIIRNMFYKEILQLTKSGMENNPSFMDVLYDLYVEHIIDYKLLTPSALHYIREGRIGSVFSSYYFRASILNPYLIYSLNKRIFRAKRIFTPTLGWGSYFYGFSQTGITHYVGVDVIPSVCSGVHTFTRAFPQIDSEIICKPSENVAKDRRFMNKYRGFFDLVFFSPPYFKLELYPGSEQSTTNYSNYEDWLHHYWEKTIQLCKQLLEPSSGKICYIISDYGSDNVGEKYNLIEDMNAITEKYFKYKEMLPMYNKNVHVTAHRETSEKIFIFES